MLKSRPFHLVHIGTLPFRWNYGTTFWRTYQPHYFTVIVSNIQIINVEPDHADKRMPTMKKVISIYADLCWGWNYL
jgi:hypothetical protein